MIISIKVITLIIVIIGMVITGIAMSFENGKIKDEILNWIQKLKKEQDKNYYLQNKVIDYECDIVNLKSDLINKNMQLEKLRYSISNDNEMIDNVLENIND